MTGDAQCQLWRSCVLRQAPDPPGAKAGRLLPDPEAPGRGADALLADLLFGRPLEDLLGRHGLTLAEEFEEHLFGSRSLGPKRRFPLRRWTDHVLRARIGRTVPLDSRDVRVVLAGHDRERESDGLKGEVPLDAGDDSTRRVFRVRSDEVLSACRAGEGDIPARSVEERFLLGLVEVADADKSQGGAAREGGDVRQQRAQLALAIGVDVSEVIQKRIHDEHADREPQLLGPLRERGLECSEILFERQKKLDTRLIGFLLARQEPDAGEVGAGHPEPRTQYVGIPVLARQEQCGAKLRRAGVGTLDSRRHSRGEVHGDVALADARGAREKRDAALGYATAPEPFKLLLLYVESSNHPRASRLLFPIGRPSTPGPFILGGGVVEVEGVVSLLRHASPHAQAGVRRGIGWNSPGERRRAIPSLPGGTPRPRAAPKAGGRAASPPCWD